MQKRSPFVTALIVILVLAILALGSALIVLAVFADEPATAWVVGRMQ